MTNIHGREVTGSNVVHVLAGGQELEILHNVGGPTGHIPGELFQDANSSLTSAEGKGIGDKGAITKRRIGEIVKAGGSDKVAYVRDDPLLAGFDELIVVSLDEAIFNDFDLLGEN